MPFGSVEPVHKGIPASAGMTRSWFCLAALALFLAVAALPARAEDWAAAVAGLAGDSFADKQKAVVELGKTGGPRAPARRGARRAETPHRGYDRAARKSPGG